MTTPLTDPPPIGGMGLPSIGTGINLTCDTFANAPAASWANTNLRLVALDTGQEYQSNGVAWVPIGASGILPFAINAQTTAYTLQVSDNGKVIECNGTFDLTLLPPTTAGANYFGKAINTGTGTIAIKTAASGTLTVAGFTVASGGNLIFLSPGQWLFYESDGTNWTGDTGGATGGGFGCSASYLWSNAGGSPSAGQARILNSDGLDPFAFAFPAVENPYDVYIHKTDQFGTDLSALWNLVAAGWTIRLFSTLAPALNNGYLIVTGASLTSSVYHLVCNAIGASAGGVGVVALAEGEPIGIDLIPPASAGGTVTSVTLTQPAAGLTLTNSGTTQATVATSTFALANDLAAVEGLSGTGLATRTATDTWTTRAITGTSGTISVSNGSGASGNPTITIDATYVGQTSITTTGTLTTGATGAGFTLAVGTSTITGILPAANGGTPIGVVMWFPYSGSLPSGWLALTGTLSSVQTVSRTTYAATFAKLSTTWGAGTGGTTFGLPPADSFLWGTSGAGGSFSVGATGGVQTVTLTSAQSGVPAHSHAGTTGFTAVPTTLPTANVCAAGSGALSISVANNTAADASSSHTNMPPYIVGQWGIFTGV